MSASTTCFRFKASFSPCTILQMLQYDLEALEKQLTDAIAKAPNFFIGSPVVLDLEKLQTKNLLDFTKIKKILIAAGLIPVGVRGGNEEQTTLAVTAGFPKVNIGKSAGSHQTETISETQKVSSTKAESTIGSIERTNASVKTDTTIDTKSNAAIEIATIIDTKSAELTSKKTKLITQPVRSGMQIFAKESDLIVVGQVSAGAELLADGHIHVYGTLRGRALAGVHGNTQARIFCSSLEAELVSIAGYYLTKEDMQTFSPHQGMIQIYLDGEHVKISSV